MKFTKRVSNKKGFVVFVVAASAMVLIPVAGLGIDAAMLYVVKARLSAACDGAALAAARNLNVGQTITAQEASARLRAESFYAGNFAEGYLGAHRNAPVITIPMAAVGNVLRVTTDGSARFVPYFMKYLGINNVDVRATGTAARRDVNIMLVLDRSLSMDFTSSCEPMKAAARNFVDRFVEGRDRLGLITFGATVYRVAPSRNFKTASPNLDTLISQIDCDGTTNMVTAYWRAYQEIITLAQPGALNIIVLFTDGIPNGFYGNFPIKTIADTRYGYSGGPCGSGSTCTVAASTCTVASPLVGVVSHYTSVGSSTNGRDPGSDRRGRDIHHQP
jgi:Mg-chelatase subunit ChlD